MAEGGLRFKNREDLEKWLKEQPDEVSICIGARAALRRLPLAARAINIGETEPPPPTRILSVFRTAAVPWTAARYPARSAELVPHARAAAHGAGADYAPSAVTFALEAMAATAFGDPSVSASAASTAFANDAFADDAFASSSDGDGTADWLWRAVSRDVQVIIDRSSADLAADALWLEGTPDWASEAWQAMAAALWSSREGWEVWIDWYEARSRGAPTWPDLSPEVNEELEVAIATLPEEIWLSGPEAANAEIKRLIEEGAPGGEAIAFLRQEFSSSGLRPSAALKELFRQAALLGPARKEDNEQLTTSLLMFAAVQLGSSARSDEDWGFLAAFASALGEMAGSAYEALRADYFRPEPPAPPAAGEPLIRKLSDNTHSVLRRAPEFRAPATPNGLLGVEACLLALLQTADAKAIRDLNRMGIKVDVLHDQLSSQAVLAPLWSSGPRGEPDYAEDETQFIADDAETDRDELGRGVLAIALARRLHRVWCQLNGAMPGRRFSAQVRPQTPDGPFYSAQWTGNEGRLSASRSSRAAFVLHLDAPWGGGKTTFANFLSRVLNPGGYEQEDASFLRQRYGAIGIETIFLADPPSNPPSADWPTDDTIDWPEDARRPWIIVPFNAWQAEHVSPPWWVFYQTIRDGCLDTVFREGTSPARPRETSKPPFNERLKKWLQLVGYEYWWRLANPKVKALLVTFAVSLVLLGLLWITGAFGSSKQNGAGYLGNGVGLVLAGLTTLSGVWGFGALFTESILPGSDTLAERLSLGRVDPFDRFRKHFYKTMERVQRPVMVIVDDLDRCKPDFIVDLVRGMQTLLRSPRVMFVILGDRDWIERAFESHHTAMSKVSVGPEQTLGARFVEKAIQMSFILPELGKDLQKRYVRQVLLGYRPMNGETLTNRISSDTAADLRHAINTSASTTGAGALEPEKVQRDVYDNLAPEIRERVDRDQVAQFVNEELAIRAAGNEEVEKDISHRLEPLAEYLPPNPRQIKRIVNAVTMYHAVAVKQTGLTPHDPRWFQLALWVIIMTEWPQTWRLLASFPAMSTLVCAVDPKQEIETMNADDLPGPKTAVLKEIARIRADRKLVALITGEGGRPGPILDEESIQDLLTLTPLYGRKVRLPDQAQPNAHEPSADPT
jgi:hypothetical protein